MQFESNNLLAVTCTEASRKRNADYTHSINPIGEEARSLGLRSEKPETLKALKQRNSIGYYSVTMVKSGAAE